MAVARQLATLFLASVVAVPAFGQEPASTTAPAAHHNHSRSKSKKVRTEPAAEPPAPPPPPPTLEQMPPSPPAVTYQNGMLSIAAENSTLGDILNAVHARTGATIDMPPGAGMNERVVIHLGPAPPRAVLADLLNGSKYDYVLVGSPTDPNSVQSILLTPLTPAPSSASAAAAGQPGAGQNLPPQARPANSYRGIKAPPADSEEEDTEVAPEPTDGPVLTQPAAPAQPPTQPPALVPGQQPPQPPPQPGQPKTPEQLLQELQQMQQQQQQQQQQPPK